jgi:diguanylate cyclase (GGDEF)-like protein
MIFGAAMANLEEGPVILDLRTICVVSGISCIVLAFVQPVGFSAGGAERWPVRWSLSNVAIGLGLLGSSLQGLAPNFVSIVLANSVTLAGYLLLLAAVRAFAGRGVSWRAGAFLVAVTAALNQFAWDDLADYPYRIAFFSVQAACYDAAIIWEGIRLARREHLASAWLLVGLFVLTALMFISRAILALSGGLGGPVMFSTADASPHPWLGAVGSVILSLRGIILLQMATERSRNLLLAQAQHDPLTGAMNRSGLERSVAQLASRRPRSSARISLLLIDIDHFKLLNDTHGHAAGDAVLCHFASVAKSQLRSCDVLARQGGDEFIAVLPDVSLDDAVRIAERISGAFNASLRDLAQLQTQPTLSIGVASGDVRANRFDAIWQMADEALYRSKREGRNRVEAMAPGVLAT